MLFRRRSFHTSGPLINRLVFATGATTSTGIVISTTNVTDDTLTKTGATGASVARTTQGVSSGKYYYEFTANMNSASNVFDVGFVESSVNLNVRLGTGVNDWGVAVGSAPIRVYNNGGNFFPTSPCPPLTTGADGIVMVALDMDNKKFWVGVNGAWTGQGGVGNPATGANSIGTLANTTYYPAVAVYDGIDKWIFNNDNIPFTYTPPAGFSSGVFV